MAELATIARPYAEALFQVAVKGGLKQIAEYLDVVTAVASDAQLRKFSSNPKATPEQIYAVMTDVIKTPMPDSVQNLLRTIIENNRLAVLPELAAQFHALASAHSGVAEAMVYSAFALEAAQLEGVLASLEKRFARKLNAKVQVEPGLIGGIRVVVGDEVLDTSVKARLEQMKAALTA